MLEDKFIVDGSDFKDLPLRATYYGRSLGFDHNERLEAIVNCVKDFVDKETSWNLVSGYEDNNCSSKCMCEQVELREMLEDAYAPDSFDIIVVTNFSQIARNKVIIDYLLDEETLNVPVFCIETGTIVTSDPENIKSTLLTCADINVNNGETSPSDHHVLQVSEVNDDEE